MLVTIDKIRLSENPDSSPTDQSKTGKLVAEVLGPFAFDLHKGGPIAGKGGGDEQALLVATLDKQNQNGHEPFDTTMRYAFGFDTVPASASAQRLNLDAHDPDYAEMITKSYVLLFVGTATWKGGTGCTSTDSAYDFDANLPKVVHFRFGFRSPTSYVNCQNPDNDPAAGLGDEEHQRGIQVKPNATTIAQVTLHTDHPFWESFVHDSPAHFDQMAAQAVRQESGEFLVTLEDLVGVNYTSFKDRSGKDLPWRSCLASYTPPNASKTMGFDSRPIAYNPNGDPSQMMRDYRDFVTYDQSTQGHLNSDGLCFVTRNYNSPQ